MNQNFINIRLNSLFFMVFLQYCAGVFVWTMILVFHLIIAALAYLFYNKA